MEPQHADTKPRLMTSYWRRSQEEAVDDERYDRKRQEEVMRNGIFFN
jgi:hypothetical protein